MEDLSPIYVPGRNELRRAGDLIARGNPTDQELNDALTSINAWRSLHIYPIDAFQKTLKARCKKIEFSDFTVAQRLKRMPSIISKLKRFDKMNLARMQDIGGVRIILPNIKDVYRLHSELISANNRFSHTPILPPTDHIMQPKDDGYRSLHQIFNYKSRDHAELDGLKIELQIRTELQHAWATAVETLDTIENTSIKSGLGSADYRRFFLLASSLFAIKEKVPVCKELSNLSPQSIALEAKKIESELKIFNKLKGVSIATRNIETISKKKSAYHIIHLLPDEGFVRVYSYKKNELEEAKRQYKQLEIDDKGNKSDIVLVSVGDIKMLKKAYPNYFLNTDRFTKELQNSFRNHIK
ncbi:RelA/SpoT domain-containing protein [Wohlfahrtiimonas chitiniclastica]|uniref:RelA/SpoT domain-containing protein n=1 Tax=Wohlfahrtiimonas chitiniclastica TaxID=400946 RepID=UPI001BCE3650|nr:RelA/SpoT domain-containing protein [Wohlfahrtiimonas chitiniclastica]MBS7837356.1 RelA/SpoT domain-containing protein [Wohlfahrtiimonas chitiniclastica]